MVVVCISGASVISGVGGGVVAVVVGVGALVFSIEYWSMVDGVSSHAFARHSEQNSFHSFLSWAIVWAWA